MASKRRALLSVADKRYITSLARDLVALGYELISTGKTFKKIKEADIPVKELARVFKAPERLDGRVKSLHADIHTALLAKHDEPRHLKELEKLGLQPFDLVVVNFYPFAERVKVGKTPIKAAVEQVDIGGPAMVRAAAKNFTSVAVVCNVEQYREVIRHLKEHDGTFEESFRLRLAREAFRVTAQYEAAIASYFETVVPDDEDQPAELVKPGIAEMLPRGLSLKLKREEQLRYGENPHQQAARYSMSPIPTLPFRVLQGKEMSFNNYLDAAAALATVSADYPLPYAACVVKHLNPCGIAVDDDPLKAFTAAREADPRSAFGGIVGLNYPVNAALANELRKTFFEIVIAPSFEDGAREQLASKKNLRVVAAEPEAARELLAATPKVTINLFGAFLQDYDLVQESWEDLHVVTSEAPEEGLRTDILLGLTFIRFLRSNSLCLVKNRVMVGRGVGQMSRVEAAELALKSAGRRASGAVLVSDGFFPFADSIELAAKAKVGCIVAPAGSKRDQEVVAAANKLGVPLVFAPYRHFMH